MPARSDMPRRHFARAAPQAQRIVVLRRAHARCDIALDAVYARYAAVLRQDAYDDSAAAYFTPRVYDDMRCRHDADIRVDMSNIRCHVSLIYARARRYASARRATLLSIDAQRRLKRKAVYVYMMLLRHARLISPRFMPRRTLLATCLPRTLFDAARRCRYYAIDFTIFFA